MLCYVYIHLKMLCQNSSLPFWYNLWAAFSNQELTITFSPSERYLLLSNIINLLEVFFLIQQQQNPRCLVLYKCNEFCSNFKNYDISIGSSQNSYLSIDIKDVLCVKYYYIYQVGYLPGKKNPKTSSISVSCYVWLQRSICKN